MIDHCDAHRTDFAWRLKRGYMAQKEDIDRIQERMFIESGEWLIELINWAVKAFLAATIPRMAFQEGAFF